MSSIILEEGLKIAEIVLLAGVKFLFAPFEAERQGFSFKESFLITTMGGMGGIVVFTFVGEGISYSWKKLKSFLFRNKKEIKKFTFLNRKIITIRQKFGEIGLALVTPSIISIPVGTIIINRLYKGKFKNIVILFFALLVWSFLLNSLAFYLRLSQYIHP
jgi:hypothetical protein